jgi:hypothetical protein
MERRTQEDRIRELRGKAEMLRARARQLEFADAKKKRALTTRKRILIGACISELARKGELGISSDQILAWLDAYLTRPGDRAAFGLAPLPEGGSDPVQDVHQGASNLVV